MDTSTDIQKVRTEYLKETLKTTRVQSNRKPSLEEYDDTNDDIAMRIHNREQSKRDVNDGN